MGWARGDDGHITGTSEDITVVVDGTTGGIRRLANARTGHVLVDGDAPIASRLSPGSVS